MTRVAIAGSGIVSAYGIGRGALRAGLMSGQPAITPLTRFPLAFADRIKLNQVDPGLFPEDEDGARAMILAAVDEALADAGLGRDALADAALLVGTSGFLYLAEYEYRRTYAATGEPSSPPLRGAGRMADRIAAVLGVTGPVLTLSTACASSANALLVGADLIRRGRVRRALVIGAEGLSAISLTGFESLMLLDPQGCRPFDADRAGLQLGEGVAALLLEADRPDARLTLAGGANRCDIHHVTSASPGGEAMAAVIGDALADADLTTADIVAVKAHGTGSEDSDLAEATALKRVFGARPPPFTAIKRYIGHTLGACGAMELTALVACVEAGRLPPAAGFATPDPELGIAPLTGFHPLGAGHTLLNFFGFGGNYAALVVRHD
jgi:3-oxoacyl-[acyl-carrier-protein] synthase I